MKKSLPKTVVAFMNEDPFNALFIYEALNRHAEYVMSLDPKDYSRSIISLNLVQDIAKDWQEMTKESI